jgi:1-acyl-sn-glycerol-3-phosphate acyltransferase
MKRTRFRVFADWLLRTVVPLLLKLDLRGQANVPTTGALILVSNHAIFFDPLVVATYAGRLVIHLAKQEVQHYPIIGLAARPYMLILVNRGAADAAAIKESLRTIRAGAALYIAPEGTRSKTGTLQPGFDGATLLALRTGAPIVPVAMWGQKDFWRNLFRLRRTPMSVHYGRPFRFVGTGNKPDRDATRAMTDEVMYRIAEMMPPEYRGVYAGPIPAWRYTQLVEGPSEPAPVALEP